MSTRRSHRSGIGRSALVAWFGLSLLLLLPLAQAAERELDLTSATLREFNQAIDAGVLDSEPWSRAVSPGSPPTTGRGPG
jgi:hypothetical protein